jgi:hypothetical protein
MLHQAALAAGGIVFMNDTLARSLIQRADGLQHSFFRFLRRTGQRCTGLSDECAGFAAIYTIANADFFVLPVALDLRLDICQSRSSKICPQLRLGILTQRGAFVQTQNFLGKKGIRDWSIREYGDVYRASLPARDFRRSSPPPHAPDRSISCHRSFDHPAPAYWRWSPTFSHPETRRE